MKEKNRVLQERTEWNVTLIQTVDQGGIFLGRWCLYWDLSELAKSHGESVLGRGIASKKVLRQERDWEIRGAETVPVELKVVIEEEMSTECDWPGGQVQGHAEPYRLYQQRWA